MDKQAREAGNMERLTVRLTMQQTDKLADWSKRVGLSQSDIVRLLLDLWFTHEVSVVQGDKWL